MKESEEKPSEWMVLRAISAAAVSQTLSKMVSSLSKVDRFAPGTHVVNFRIARHQRRGRLPEPLEDGEISPKLMGLYQEPTLSTLEKAAISAAAVSQSLSKMFRSSSFPPSS